MGRGGGAEPEALAGGADALDEPGVYEASYESRSVVFSLNSPPAESSPIQSTEEDLMSNISLTEDGAGSSEGGGRGVELWRFLALAALLMTVVEQLAAGSGQFTVRAAK